MRRFLLFALFGLLAPVGADAQPRLMVGGGFSAPSGSISDAADPGFHLRASLQVTLPTLPLALRGDGTFHRFGSSVDGAVDPEILAGSGSLVYTLPGVSLQPYLLAGIGSYRTEAGPIDEPVAVTETGYHGGFGVAVGGLGLGAFAEIRYIHITGDESAALIPLTLGLRF
jgi:hypothetical protein